MSKWVEESLLEAADGLIRQARLNEAGSILRSAVNHAHGAGAVPPRLRARFANLCRRAGLNATGLRVLRPSLFDVKSGALLNAAPDERAEYAMLLLRVGAVREAGRWLDDATIAGFAPAALYRGFVKITTWDYREAREDLRQYLTRDLDPYARQVGELNLAAAALYSGDPAEAQTALNAVLAKAQGRLRANALDLQTRLHFDSGDRQAAERALVEAESLLAGATSYDQLFLMGLRALLEASRSGDHGYLLEFRHEALRRGRFESVREADYFRARLRPDPTLFTPLYFGTPYAGFRRLVADACGLEPTARIHEWGNGDRLLNLDPATPGAEDAPFHGRPAQLLRLLYADRYRPFAVGAIFQEIYPKEFFDIHSSPGRVMQLIYRLRESIKDGDIDLQIARTGSLYQAVEGSSIRVRVGIEVDAYTSAREFVLRLREEFGPNAEFRFRDMQATLGMSRASLRRRLDESLAAGDIEKFGAGPETRYSLTASSQLAPRTHTPRKSVA